MSTSAKRRKMRVLFAGSEAVPFSKTGGLGVWGGPGGDRDKPRGGRGEGGGARRRPLTPARARAAVITPLYATIPQQYKDQMKHVADFYVPLAWRNIYCGIEKVTLQGLDFYFIDNKDYFARDKLYGYFDDGQRYAYYAKAI